MSHVLLFILIIFTFFTLSSQHLPFINHNFIIRRPDLRGEDGGGPGGKWTLLHNSVGISAMHIQLLYNNKIIIFDRTDFGPSNLTLPEGKCRFNDAKMKRDCTAHSILYDVPSNTYRPLMVQSNVWCSSGAVHPDGSLVQTGGYLAGEKKIRLFTPCNNDTCDWVELLQDLTVKRWYATNHILPDGRVIIVGGIDAFSYEFFPKNPNKHLNMDVHELPFLKETTDPVELNNLYPFLHLMPDGNLYIFANNRSILFDYVNNKVIKEFPVIPGEKRTYPCTGSSVLLPIRFAAGKAGESPLVEVMVCGGAMGGAFFKSEKGIFDVASTTCGRLRVTDPNPQWVMEDMPMPRVMPDMILLPTGNVFIVNGAQKGSAGWEAGEEPVLQPVLYMPDEPYPAQRFVVLNPSTIPRMYHSAASLMPDGRVLVGGSNPHELYNFTGVRYPTDLSLEAYIPDYMDQGYNSMRPTIDTVGALDNEISYGQEFSIEFSVELYRPDRGITVSMVLPSFTTHSFAMNQRLLVLPISNLEILSSMSFRVTVHAPPTTNLAPPGYYMLFVVNDGVPSHSVWIRMK
ncbi:hypothetical protein ACJIZ3_025211 [Penstemon smallii]|uniref:Galactose oxidase n=1 Tax=Penstemon smallii TaxID=265156 RepID=A0ABD3TUB8_9LAMI